MITDSRVLELHPCFGKKKNTGRIHLPVCPGCNIQCNFCDRRISGAGNRPGLASAILTPGESLGAVRRAMALCPDIHVVGIAGPGDTLVSDRAVETFRLIRREYPALLKCMSTNGLLLEERADELIELGIDSLTVTVNAVDPGILARIVSGIYYHGKRYFGVGGAALLIEKQLGGIRKIKTANAGITVKVNTVLIPEINGRHIGEIAKAVAGAGADICNLIPLIPRHRLAYCAEPSCDEIYAARLEAEAYIDVFRHCQRCRADAVGIPGQSDFADEVYQRRSVAVDTFSHG
jgi:nitrogen fixation protein NifB